MSTWSPTAEGFRTILRRPALSLAEISWRWSFGAAACVLLGLSFIAYLDTLPVDRLDLLLLRTGQPVLVAKAFSHIFRGSALGVALASIVLFSALALLWILLGSAGRGATLLSLRDHIRERASHYRSIAGTTTVPKTSDLVSADTTYNWRLRSLAGLHFLRAVLALAAGLAAVGAMIVSGFFSTQSNPHPGLGFLFAIATIFFLWLIWYSISWFLSTASIFVVHKGTDTFAALSSTVDLCRERLGPVLAVGTWFGLAHLVLFLVATSAVAFPFAFVPVVPLGMVLTAVLFLTLIYFAFVDTLYIGRLAGYLAILEAPQIPVPAPILPAQPSGQHSAVRLPEIAMVDQDEVILSDTPDPSHEHASSVHQLPSMTSSESEGTTADTPSPERKSTHGGEPN